MSSFTVQRHINAKFVGLLCTAVFVVCSFQGFSITDSNRNFPINILMPVTIEPQNITVTNFGSITILIIVNKIEETANYQTALDSLECYAKIHNYRFRIEEDGKFSAQCPQKDNFFRRHCITSILLSESDYTLFLDADMGVVNPYRRIENFIDPRSDILFYDRFYDQEVTAGSYIVKNTPYAQKFLKGYADYFYKLPKSFHGTDNGALHAYLAETIFPNRTLEFSLCMELYNKSADYADLFSYIACIRDVMGKHEQFGKIRIMKKGTGWARDNWLTNSKWSPNRDFIIHGWKKNQLKTYSTKDLPLSLDWTSKSEWFNPIAGRFQLEQCTSSNLTWLYDPNLIATKPEIETKLAKMEREVEMEKYKFLGRIPKRLMQT